MGTPNRAIRAIGLPRGNAMLHHRPDFRRSPITLERDAILPYHGESGPLGHAVSRKGSRGKVFKEESRE